MLVEPIHHSDRSHLLAVAIDTGLFAANEAELLLGEIIDSLASGTLPEGHEAVCCRFERGLPAVGWSYFAPDQHAENVWNIWWIGVDPGNLGTGAGQHLLRHVEGKIASSGGRLVVIETSAADSLARARRFYQAQGYTECGRVPDFYAIGESKVIFARHPRAA